MISSESRGALVAIICWYASGVVYLIITRNKKVAETIIMIPILIVSVTVLIDLGGENSNCIAGFIDEIKENKIENTIKSDENNIIFEKIQEGSSKWKKYFPNGRGAGRKGRQRRNIRNVRSGNGYNKWQYDKNLFI